MMHHNRGRIFRFAALSLFFLPVLVQMVWAKAPLKSIDTPQGGKIVYGVVEGAKTEAGAMGNVLSAVHNNCGEKPQIGKVFKVRGTNSNAVFFTVVNHPAGNKLVAGLVIASQTGPRSVEAALVSDEASRFGSTMNPMLKQLFNVWRPGSQTASSDSTVDTHSAPPAHLRWFTAADKSAKVGIPDGWQAKGSGGTMMVMKPSGKNLPVIVQLNLTRMAVDPRNPAQRQQQAGGLRSNNSGKIVYPANVDLTKAFPDLFRQFWRLNNTNVSDLQIDHAENMPGGSGGRCVHVMGHVKLGVPVSEEINSVLCTTVPSPMGIYLLMLSFYLLPPEVANQERATAGAILASFQPNQAVIRQQAGAIAAPAIRNIHQIGQQATARYNATQAANDAQHRAWNNQQDSNSRNVQGFSNYLLDQTVVQDNYRNTHSTEWNRTADALVKAHPNRFEIVDTPNYWKGIDY